MRTPNGYMARGTGGTSLRGQCASARRVQQSCR